jgi:hypothetical protein
MVMLIQVLKSSAVFSGMIMGGGNVTSTPPATSTEVGEGDVRAVFECPARGMSIGGPKLQVPELKKERQRLFSVTSIHGALPWIVDFDGVGGGTFGCIGEKFTTTSHHNSAIGQESGPV